MTLSGRHCVVVGSAPLARPITVNTSDVLVAVNGGIASAPFVDVWVLNARSASDPATVGWKRGLNALMLEQGQGRQVEQLLLLEKGEGAVAHTLAQLRRLKVRHGKTPIIIHNEQRRDLEAQAGARSPEMTPHALSAGMFAAAWCFLQGAETVRLEGFSWTPGYAYTTETPHARGHEAGDKAALARLEERYRGRLIHTLTKEKTMAKKAIGRAATPATRATARTSRQAAKAATSPAAERAKKVEKKQAEAEAAKVRPRRLLVRATELTQYNNRRRRPGEVFQLREESNFRPSCMEWAGEGAKETPRPTVENARPKRLKPNAADVEDDDAPAGRPNANNPLGV